MPDSREIFERYAQRYDQWYQKGEGRIIAPIELEALRTAMGKEIPHNSIEVGVGTGYFAEKLGIGYGVDPALSPLRIAQQRNIEVVQGYAEYLPIKDAIFSLALMVVTICFVDDPMESIREASRILKDGGRIILGIVHRNSPWGKDYLHKKEQGHIFYSRARFFTVSELIEMLDKTGFTNITGVSTLYQPPSKSPKPRDRISTGLDENAGFVVIMGEKRGD